MKSLRIAAPCLSIMLLTACGGGSGGVTTYNVSATAGSGGSISPATAIVDAGSTTNFTVTPGSGYVIGNVTGCGGTLSGSIFTTAKISADCTVTANFVAAWTWVGGSDTVDAAGVYGTQGTASTSNIPGARVGAATWTDASGNTWLFGGGGSSADFSDLWKYSAASGEWTWVGGPGTTDQAGVYGTQGSAAAANNPGARFGSATWTDASGNLWLFGGWGYDAAGAQGDLNDLWKYSPATGEWTWVSGPDIANQAGVYGTQGSAAPANLPPARNTAVAWIDGSGNLWIFGGRTGQNQGTSGYFNDVWMYSPQSGEWTWVEGSSSEDQSGTYGTKGTAASTNIPGARANATVWTDASGNVWLFGGWGQDSAGNVGDLNDLWEFLPGSGGWRWTGGSNVDNQPAVYGTEGTAAAANVPGARNGAVTWLDTRGNVWMFGGYGIDSTGANGFLSELWEYSSGNGEWTWVGGPNVANESGVYGALGVSATSNLPGARCCAATWTDANGNLWLFGGAGYDSKGTQDALNDLWKYPTR